MKADSFGVLFLRSWGLSHRAARILAARKILSKESAAAAVRSGRLHPFLGHNAIPKLGPHSYLEICRWAGVIMPEPISKESVALVLELKAPYPWSPTEPN